MKKIMLSILGAIGILLVVMIVKTVMASSKQLKATELIQSPGFETIADDLSTLIQIQSISYDDKNAQASVKPTLDFLKNRFPLIFSKLEITELPMALILIWKPSGSTTELPIMFSSHLDVVPAAQPEMWEQNPFSGKIIDGYVFGRGAIDDKSGAVSIFSALEKHLEQNHTTKRPIYFVFGFDEEIGGRSGAIEADKWLKSKNLHFACVFDEGGAIYQDINGIVSGPTALVGTSEKGYLTVDATASLPGGHSSMPNPETAPNILMTALLKVESQKSQIRLIESMKNMIEYVTPEMAFPKKMFLANLWLTEPLVLKMLEKKTRSAAMIRTSWVTTQLNAGEKENVIPSIATAVLNSRLLPGDTVEGVLENLKKTVNDPRIEFKVRSNAGNPSKISTTESDHFIKIQKALAHSSPDAIVIPSITTGATDSRHFSTITDNTYRFRPWRLTPETVGMFHGLNEKVKIENLKEGAFFFYALLNYEAN